MRNCVPNRMICTFTALLLTLAVFTSACQQGPAANSNTSANTTTVNTNTSTTNTSTTTPPISGTPIEAREPDKYSATITLRIAAQGEGQTTTTSTPPLAADFVKNGADRRVSIKVGNEQLVFLDSGTKRYIIAPNRRQYAELTPESTGFEVPTVMTPGQIISSVKGMSGCERQTEEQVNGRAATKYRCAGKSSTGTQAGEVTSETFVYIDKETGLPLRSESDLTASGNVQGMKGLKIVTELSNIKTEVDASQFAEPQGMSKVAPEQVRQQLDLVLRAVQAIAGQMMSNTMSRPPTGSATPAAGSTASPSASPAR